MKQSIASVAVLLCAGCALGVPSGVRVKTAPAIRVSSGGTTTKLDDYLSADILKNLLGDYLDAEYYKYVPEDDKNTLHILVRYRLIDIKDIPLGELLQDEDSLKEFFEELELYPEYTDATHSTIRIDMQSKISVNENPITGISLAEFKKALPDNLGFKSVAAEIYAGPADKGYQLRGHIFAKYNGESSEFMILGEHPALLPYEDATVNFMGEMPIPLKKKENPVLTPDDFVRYPKPSFPKDGSEPLQLKTVLNEFPEDLGFYFDVAPQIGEEPRIVTLSVAETIETMDSLQLYVDMVLDISLAFVVVPPAKSAVMQLDKIPGIDAGGEQDIFGRKSAKENGELFDGVQTATLRLNYDNSLTSSDLTANIQVRPDARALTVRPFTVKHGANQTVEVALDAGYVRDNLPYPLTLKDIELALTPKNDPDHTLFSFSPGEDGTGGSFTLRGFEVETALDCTFPF